MDHNQDADAQGQWHAEQERIAAMNEAERIDYYFANPPDTHSPYAQDAWERGYSGVDTAPDGRPLMVATANGPQPYAEYHKPQRDEK